MAAPGANVLLLYEGNAGPVLVPLCSVQLKRLDSCIEQVGPTTADSQLAHANFTGTPLKRITVFLYRTFVEPCTAKIQVACAMPQVRLEIKHAVK